jgi:type II secretory pathway component GspD/PulD (secretin)
MILLKWLNRVPMVAGCALALALFTTYGVAQDTGNENRAPERKLPPEVSETIFLNNATSMNDLNDIQTALRNSFTRARLYGVAGQYALTVRGSAEDVAAAKKMVTELDRPRKVYRVTYTVTESDAGKRTGSEHFSLIVASGTKSTLKQGNRVPLITGMSGESPNAAQGAQVQYIDTGLNIEATIEGAALKTKVEQSAVADEKSGIGVQDPVIRQTMVEGLSSLDPGRPVVLGSLDIPGTTRHQEIAVTTELLTK